jgi:hypothetical protein
MTLLSLLSVLLIVGGMYLFILPKKQLIAKKYFPNTSDLAEQLTIRWFYITSKVGAVMLLFFGFLAFLQAWGMYREQAGREHRNELQASVAFTLRDSKLMIVNKSMSDVQLKLTGCSNSNMTYLLYPELTPKDYSHIKPFQVQVTLSPQKSQSVNVECTKGLCSNADTFITCKSVTSETVEGSRKLDEVRFPLDIGKN